METFDSAKIVDAELCRFAATQDTDERRSVIVELGVAPTPIELTFDRRTGLRPRDRLAPRGDTDRMDLPDVEGHAEFMDELQRQLSALAGEAVRLDAAHAFVVSVTPVQLRALSLLPLAGIIRPNRRHYAPSHA